MAGTLPAGAPTGEDRRPVKHALLALQTKRIEGRRPGNEPNPLNEFVGGVGEGLYDVGTGTVAEVHAALTTNPATTVRNAGRELAAMIDTAIAAKDTPARIQVSRAASAVANASARDIGRATGKAAGNVALAVAPGRRSPRLPHCAVPSNARRRWPKLSLAEIMDEARRTKEAAMTPANASEYMNKTV